jgi:type II secretory pathway pseudopilin PulG
MWNGQGVLLKGRSFTIQVPDSDVYVALRGPQNTTLSALSITVEPWPDIYRTTNHVGSGGTYTQAVNGANTDANDTLALLPLGSNPPYTITVTNNDDAGGGGVVVSAVDFYSINP